MKDICDFSKDFFEFFECKDIEVNASVIENFSRLTASHKDTKIIVWSQANLKWGTDEATFVNTKWDDERFPYRAVSIVLPNKDRESYTHFVLFSHEGMRACLIPASCLENATNGKAQIAHNGNKIDAETALVENWTPKVTFFIKSDGQWQKDQNNIWKKPQIIPDDPMEYLNLLSGNKL